MNANPSQLNIVVADDHAVVRSGLSIFLQDFEDIELVGEASNGLEAVKLCEKIGPDVVLMDLNMPVMDGVEATRLIRQRCPHTQVVALTSYQNSDQAYDVIQAGAIAYLTKSVMGEELADAIRAAHAGRPTLAPEAAQALIETTQSRSPLTEPLTSREQEVLALLVQGLNNPQIAQTLHVSRSTAKFHVSRILAKLRVKSRIEAVSLAIQYNLVK